MLGWHWTRPSASPDELASLVPSASNGLRPPPTLLDVVLLSVNVGLVLLVLCFLITFTAFAFAAWYVWYHYLDADRDLLRDPWKWAARKGLSYWLGCEVLVDRCITSRSPWSITVEGLAVPNPEPPLGLDAWSSPTLISIGRVSVGFDGWQGVLSLLGYYQDGQTHPARTAHSGGFTRHDRRALSHNTLATMYTHGSCARIMLECALSPHSPD